MHTVKRAFPGRLAVTLTAVAMAMLGLSAAAMAMLDLSATACDPPDEARSVSTVQWPALAQGTARLQKSDFIILALESCPCSDDNRRQIRQGSGADERCEPIDIPCR